MAPETVVAPPAPPTPAPAPPAPPVPYSGLNRRLKNVPYDHPERRNVTLAGVGGSVPPGARPAARTQVRAKFVVTEITKTFKSGTRLTLGAFHDPAIKGDSVMLSSTNPIGTLSITVDPAWADANIVMGSVFYLASA